MTIIVATSCSTSRKSTSCQEPGGCPLYSCGIRGNLLNLLKPVRRLNIRHNKAKTQPPEFLVLRTGTSSQEVACTSTIRSLVRRPWHDNTRVMSDDGNQPVCDLRDAIASALQTDPPTNTPSVITAWIIIAEYASADGSRYIVQRNGAAPDSDHATTPWQRRGLLYEVLDTGLIEDEQDIVFELEDEDGDDE